VRQEQQNCLERLCKNHQFFLN